MGFPERVDRTRPVLQRQTQGFASVRAGLDNLAEGNGFPRQFSADGPTEKAMIVKDTNLGHVPGIIANDDLFAHVGGQRRIQRTETLERNPVLAHLAAFGDGQS
jgi:hypothetical protein